MLIFLLSLTLVCCEKKTAFDKSESVTKFDDARTVLLKDINSHPLPTPYFHFEYDELHYAKRISFASDLFIYDVEYKDKRVIKMTNLRNPNTLYYSYDNGQVSEINEFSRGQKTYNYRFVYDGTHMLTQVFWTSFHDHPQGDIVKRADLTYQADSNLESISFYYANKPGDTLTFSSRDEFSEYDDKVNVDDITLLKGFFESYLFLPQVKLQKNNPMKERLTGAESEYQITSTYTYQNNLPIDKTSLVVQTRGRNNNGPTQVSSQYTYY
jgi:hypothetical protein